MSILQSEFIEERKFEVGLNNDGYEVHGNDAKLSKYTGTPNLQCKENAAGSPEAQDKSANPEDSFVELGDGSRQSYPAHSGNDGRNGSINDADTLPVGILPKKESEQLTDAKKNENLMGDWRLWMILKNFSCAFLQSHNKLPSNPTMVEKLKYAFSCPPHGMFGYILTWCLFLILGLGSLVYTTHEQALPGGSLFSLLVLVILAQLGGLAVAKVKLPPLLGMLLVGIMVRNIPGLDVIGKNIKPAWSSSLRSTALVVILIRAGLGLDPKALRKLSLVVVRLAFMPCISEAVIAAVVSYFLLEFPWKWGFMLGFVLAAVSPAVVVPCLLSLQEQGWGVDKGVPTLVIAAASIDDVLAISGFGVSLGLAFSTGSSLEQGLKGPIDFIVGVGYGIILGFIMWVIPNRKLPNLSLWRFIVLLLAGLLAIFGSKGIGHDGAGALGVLCVSFVAGIGYRKYSCCENGLQVKDYFSFLWKFFQPMLFGLIGTEIMVSSLDPSTIMWGTITILICLCFRVCVSFFAVLGAGFSLKERIFVAIAWLPKATVQAAIGSTALDYARDQARNSGISDASIETGAVVLGGKVLTIAVLSILLTAPLGAVAIMLTAPRLLKKTPVEDEVREQTSL